MAYGDGTPITLSPVSDITEDATADDINPVYTEIESIRTALGAGLNLKDGAADLVARLAAIQAGLAPAALTIGNSAAAGTSKVMARNDHVHQMPANIKSTDLNTATGSASGSSDNTDVTMNDYSFFPSVTNNGGTQREMKSKDIADPSNTIGAFRIGAGSGTWTIRWRYVTASRPPELVVLRDSITGEIVAVWKSEIQGVGSPLVCPGNPSCEAIEITKFPDGILEPEVDAVKILKDLRANKIALADKIARVPKANNALMLEAKRRGRVIIKGASLGELI